MSDQKYPHEFLGRCQVCLDNAYLSAKPCEPSMWLQGHPISAAGCPVYRAQQSYTADLAARAALDPVKAPKP